jgi:hypothetical protein
MTWSNIRAVRVRSAVRHRDFALAITARKNLDFLAACHRHQSEFPVNESHLTVLSSAIRVSDSSVNSPARGKNRDPIDKKWLCQPEHELAANLRSTRINAPYQLHFQYLASLESDSAWLCVGVLRPGVERCCHDQE